MFKKLNTQQKGFTLIEVLVVVGILAILLAITLIALNPAKHFQSTRNAQRTSDVTAFLNGIYEYQAANKGSLPPSVAGVTTAVDLAKDSPLTLIDVCADLVPTYIADLPLDPATGVKAGATVCGSATYNTGYQIAKNGTRFTISAPDAEDSAIISVTR
jgi:type IV pilus assembly protein PilA